MEKMPYRQVLSDMERAVKAAVNIMLSPERFNIEQKGDHDYVTECDRKVQACLIEHLSPLYPDVAFVAEEMENAEIDDVLSGKCFVIDPIDGTNNFMNNFPVCAISIAYVENHRPLAGIVYNPFMNEAFFATRGGGSYLSLGLPLTKAKTNVVAAVKTEQGLVIVEDSWKADKNIALNWFLGTRILCSASLSICYVGAGRVCSYISVPLHAWDIAAANLIAEEAGCVITDGEGRSLEGCIYENIEINVGKEQDMKILMDVRYACENDK